MAWVKELLPRVPLQFATMHGHLNRRPFKIVKYQIVKISSRNDKDKIRVQTAQLNHFGLPAPVPSSSFQFLQTGPQPAPPWRTCRPRCCGAAADRGVVPRPTG